MPSFGKGSRDNLNSADKRLILVFQEVVKRFDCSVISGRRGKAEQNRLFKIGKSKLTYPDSKHNPVPSLAVDVCPYYPDGGKIRWNDTKGFAYFAGYVLRTAEEMGVKLRWGGDWDMDFDTQDQDFNDLPHFEIVDE